MFSVFHDKTASKLMATYATFDEAVAAMLRNNALVLPDGVEITDPVVINSYGASIYTGQSGASVVLGEDVGVFRQMGANPMTVQTSDVETRVYGNDADNTYIGGDARDIFYGGSGADAMQGGAGDDVFYGGAGKDIMFLNAGMDRAYGGAGDDKITAGEGQSRLYGGEGADSFTLDMSGDNLHIIFDFEAADDITLTGLTGATDLTTLLARGASLYESKGHTILKVGAAQLQLRDFALDDLAMDHIVVNAAQSNEEFESPREFFISGLTETLTSVTIDGVVYNRRNAEPLHQDYKFIDQNGGWWSPDYLVIVAAGQSNMVGAAKGADMTINPNVSAYDYVNDVIVDASYSTFPAITREGQSPRNNLYFPMANEVSETLERPVLVIAHPVSGSRIDSWLESGTGELWADLNAEVAAALTLVDQDKADAFIWHQGESDYPVDTAVYQSKIEELIVQVRAQEWGGSDLDILMGELSREGVNYVQNIAYQNIEMAETDPNLTFVSSAGLSSDELSGVHFDAGSLVEFGSRFAQALFGLREGDVQMAGNTAPTVNPDADIVTSITMAEGQEFRLDISDYFTDAEGDTLYFYSYMGKRNVYLAEADQTTDELVITPNYHHAGNHTLYLYANDYLLDGPSIAIDLTITEATPLVHVYNNRSFDTIKGSYRDFEAGQGIMSRNRGIEILDQAALNLGYNMLEVETTHVRGAAGMTGTFALADGISQGYLYGAADFDLMGNTLDNYLVGSDGVNVLIGDVGKDRLYGNAGNDILIGGSQNDQLRGGDGDDDLDAGTGSDNVWGEGGADTFRFTAGDGQMQIRDYDGTDTILLQQFAGIQDFDDLMANAALRQSNTRVIVDIGDDRILINDTNLADISADMFDFA